MKKINKIFAISAVVMTAGVALQSCQSEAPFSTDGEGLVRLCVDVNSKLTRAVEGEEELKANARIYISNDKGVLNKWVGTQNIPKDGIYLRYGSYVAEAMAGDSASASFTKKYFKGASDFSISGDVPMANVAINCRIANVVASIEESTIDSKLMQDLKVTIGNSRGELIYSADSLYKQGYFMMPNGDTSLNYTVTGINSKGHEFTKSGVIENVKPSTHYRLEFNYTPAESDQGGAFFTISISEESLVEDEVTIYGKPSFSWLNNDPALDAQIIGTPGSFTSKTLRIAAYKGFKSLMLQTEDSYLIGFLGSNKLELVGLPETIETDLERKGLLFTESDPKENLYRKFIQFAPEFFNSLPERETEYVMTVMATDNNGKKAQTLVRIANTEAAIVYADPIIIEFEDFQNDFTSVSARSVTIPVNITDVSVENPAVQYRKSGESAWTTVPVNSTRAAGGASVRLTGLTPATAYQFRVVAGAFVDGAYEFESEEIGEFTTEGEFTIPNASMEEWSNFKDNSKVLIPSGDGTVSFWDSGNHGSSTMNKLVTNKSTSIFHAGTTSAELKSQFVGIGSIGKFAAGNLFVGSYDETQGTDGVLTFGRPYNGSHPSAVSIWANYRPGTVEKKGAADGYLKEGDTDKGQIYVALTTGGVKVRTKTKQLFNPAGDANDDCSYDVIAYGQVTWDAAFGEDNQLANIKIPFEYTEKAKTMAPTHLVIVCSASKFGDYFCGGEGSLLYVDDFELVYE